MTEIVKPTITHLKGINSLLEKSGLEPISAGMLKDLCVAAINDGKVVGFIWAMVSKSREMSYVDYFCVDRAHRGLAGRLIKYMLMDAAIMGIKRVFTMVPDKGDLNDLAAFKINCAVGLRPRRVRYHLFDSRIDALGGLWVSRKSSKTLTTQMHKLNKLGKQMNQRKDDAEKNKKS